MRLTEAQLQAIRRIAREEAGVNAQVRVFGSRVRDDVAGGDLDLMVTVPERVDAPAMLSARISARVSRVMYGRRVDVVIDAPNLERLPIHAVAEREGVPL
jgi:predicted nucleotidyltransferase